MNEREITFVNPRDFCKFIPNTPYPPLGVGYLASVLRERDYQVSLIDGQILLPDKYEEKLAENEAEIVGITAVIKQMQEAKRVASVVKSRNQETTVIIGGAGPNSLPPENVLKSGVIDILIRGEAEFTLPRLLEALRTHSPLDLIPNIVYFESGNLIKTKTASPPAELDSIPFPARDIYPQAAYLARWMKNTGMTSTTMISSRGCSFACIFCDKTVSGRGVRIRSSENVVDEMQALAEEYYPLDDIFFYDDLFVCDRKRVLTICDEILKRKLNVSWSAQARVDRVDLEMLKQMKKAGCSELCFGAESGSNRILKYLRKGFSREQVVEAFRLCHQAKIKPGIFVIVGVLGEAQEDINATKSLIKEVRPHLLNFSYLVPFPNTPLYKKTGHLLATEDYTQWDEMTQSPYKSECFEIDPKEAHDQIYDVFKELVAQGMEHSNLQFICDQ